MDGTVPIKLESSICLKEIITTFFFQYILVSAVTDALTVMTPQRHEQKHPLFLILLVFLAASLALLCPAFSRQRYPLSTAPRTLPAEPTHFRDCLWRRVQ